MKQHKASRKNGSTRQASRSGAPRKATAGKTPSPEVAARASGARNSKVVARTAGARSSKAAAAGKRAPAAPSGLVKLPAECLISSLGDLRTQLIERVAIETPVSFDASSVERIDTAALQLLAAFTRDRTAAGLPVEWQSACRRR